VGAAPVDAIMATTTLSDEEKLAILGAMQRASS
jgi:protein-disulfide isomerase-like protein with CxxC motif